MCVKAIISAIVCSPELQISAELAVTRALTIRPALQLQNEHKWVADGLGSATGHAIIEGRKLKIKMSQDANGLTWQPSTDSDGMSIREDVSTLIKQARKSGISFDSHPLTSSIP